MSCAGSNWDMEKGRFVVFLPGGGPRRECLVRECTGCRLLARRSRKSPPFVRVGPDSDAPRDFSAYPKFSARPGRRRGATSGRSGGSRKRIGRRSRRSGRSRACLRRPLRLSGWQGPNASEASEGAVDPQKRPLPRALHQFPARRTVSPPVRFVIESPRAAVPSLGRPEDREAIT